MTKLRDVIWGDVTNVMDGDTFNIHITHVGRLNRLTYNEYERIRIARLDAPELPSAYGFLAKRQLKHQLKGRHVKCVIHSRDRFGRLICTVE